MALYRCWGSSSSGGGNLQEKTVTAGTTSASFTPDSGYDGFSKVTVEPTPSEEKNGVPLSTGVVVVEPSSGKLLSKVTISKQTHDSSYPAGGGYYEVQSGSQESIDLTQYHKVRYVNVKALPSGNVQAEKTVQNLSPNPNWSGSTTAYAEIDPDSGYDSMKKVRVSAPMIRDGEMLHYATKTTPGTIYKGDTAYSNSKELIRVQPYKNGMAYTASYLYVDPDEWGGGGGTSPTGNATEADVLSGKTFSNSSGTGKTGTMPDKSGWTATGTAGQNTTIPKGYHDGTGYVTCPSGGGGTETVTTLWTNSSPTTSMTGTTAITFSQNYSNFDYIRFTWRVSTSNSTSNSIMVKKSDLDSFTTGSNIPYIFIGARGASNYFSRRLEVTGSKNMNVCPCYQFASTSAMGANCILTKVEGIKLT